MDGPIDESSSGSKNESVVNFDDPLYVHSFDNAVTSVINFKLLGTENYMLWCSAIIRALKSRSKLAFSNGTVPKPIIDPIKESKWERENVVTYSWILGSISDNIYVNHACSESAQEIWAELFETSNKADGSVNFNVHQKINSLT